MSSQSSDKKRFSENSFSNDLRLVFRLSLNDFKKRYAGSYLGFIWALVQPVVTVFMYWFVFDRFFNQKGQLVAPGLDIPYVLYLTSGLVPWFFFSECMSQGTNALHEYTFLVKQVVFKVSILPLIKCVAAVFTHAFFVVVMIVVAALYGIYPSVSMLQFIYYSFCLFVLAAGLVYLTSALDVFFRDLSQIINVLLQLGMWATPILWNVNIINDSPVLVRIIKLNPLFYITDGYRKALAGGGWFVSDVKGTLYFWGVTVLVFLFGTFVFKRLRPRFADVL
jgi:teichoic acid transport system permease protein